MTRKVTAIASMTQRTAPAFSGGGVLLVFKGSKALGLMLVVIGGRSHALYFLCADDFYIECYAVVIESKGATNVPIAIARAYGSISARPQGENFLFK